MTRNAIIVAVIVILIVILAPRVFGATILAIEAHPCGVIHTRHETHDGAPVLMTERGSRKYVCGVYPENPFAGDLYAKIPPEIVGNEYFPVVPVSPDVGTIPAAFQLDRRGATASAISTSRSDAGAFSFTVTVREPERLPDITPVPAPGAALMLLGALAMLFTWRTRRCPRI